MPNCSKNEVILVRYPFSDLTSAKVRPAVVVGAFPHSPDCLIVLLTRRIDYVGASSNKYVGRPSRLVTFFSRR